ncbi:MAG: hypothetical protein OER21_15020 [Gemmatimonadota bacterium]|nr:hypothetical protein [Gemmatimonadota bacterium]
MRLTRLIPAFAVALLGVACAQDAPTAPDGPQLSEHAGPIEIELENIPIQGVNPCTGLPFTGVATGTLWIQPHPNNRVIRVRTTSTTSDGYTGRYEETWQGSDIPGPAGPGDVSTRTFNLQMSSPSGSRYMVHLVWVLDLKTSPPTQRVDQFSARCIHP